jgi:hypothetical protein
MPDRLELHPRRLAPQKLCQILDGAVVTEIDAVTPALLRGDDALRRTRDEVRRGVDALDLAAELCPSRRPSRCS